MKITRILPKFLAKSWQEYDLNKVRAYLDYHRKMAQIFEQLEQEGEKELQRLNGGHD